MESPHQILRVSGCLCQGEEGRTELQPPFAGLGIFKVGFPISPQSSGTGGTNEVAPGCSHPWPRVMGNELQCRSSLVMQLREPQPHPTWDVQLIPVCPLSQFYHRKSPIPGHPSDLGKPSGRFGHPNCGALPLPRTYTHSIPETFFA